MSESSSREPIETGQTAETKPAFELGLAKTVGLDVSAGAAGSSLPTSGRESAARLPLVERAIYKLEADVAEGGIGRIRSARDTRLDRTVALKELLDTSSGIEERFVREALLTARLQHPSIVPVYEAGRWPSGEPFYAMKLVSGRPLSEVIDATKTLDERLPLLTRVLSVAEAVAYAHEKHIIHRDLKPANVLVGEYGETVVIDWGLAKDLSDTAPEKPVDDSEFSAEGREAMPSSSSEALTIMGSVMGTPAYMPPEQAAGEPVDERADVYALGAILRHVLSGKAPYVAESGLKVLTLVLEGPPEPLDAVQKGIPRDLLAIVDKAMARDASLRYPTAKAFAEDLRRFLAGQLVGAHQYSRKERALRFARKHRAALSVAFVAVCLFVTGAAYSLKQIIHERDRATHEQHLAEAAQQEASNAEHSATLHADELTLVEARSAVRRDPNEALAWLKTLSPSFSAWSAARVIAADALTHGPALVLREQKGAINTIDLSRDGTLLAAASDDRTIRIYDLRNNTSRVLTGHDDEAWFVMFTAEDKRLISTSSDRTIRLWDLETGKQLSVLRGHTRAVLYALPSADGRTLYSHSDDTTVRQWDVESGKSRVLAEGSDRSAKAMFSSDLTRFVAAGEDGTVYLHEGPDFVGKQIPGVRVPTDRFIVGPMFPFTFRKDGRQILMGGLDGRVYLWDINEKKMEHLDACNKPVARVAFSADSAEIAAGCADGAIHVWNQKTGKQRVFPGEDATVLSLVFSPDGRNVLTGGFDKIAHLIHLETGQKRDLAGSRDTITNVRFSRDGTEAIVASADGTIRVYPLDSGSGRLLGRHEAPMLSVNIAPTGDRVVSADENGKVWIWPLHEPSTPLSLEGHTAAVTQAIFAESGDTLATTSLDGVVRLWDHTGHEIRAFDTKTPGHTPIAYAADGRHLAIGNAAGSVWVWNIDSGAEQALGACSRAVNSVAFSPDGTRVAAACRDMTARIWYLESGKERVFSNYGEPVLSIAFSPNGSILASGSRDHKLYLWQDGWPEPHPFDAGGYLVSSLRFLPDNQTLLTTGGDSTIRVWDAQKGALLRLLRAHRGPIYALALSRDGTTAASAGNDKTVRLWDIATGESRILGRHDGIARAVAIAPDGTWVASAGDDGAIQVWQDDLPRQPEALRQWIHGSTADTVDMSSTKQDQGF